MFPASAAAQYLQSQWAPSVTSPRTLSVHRQYPSRIASSSSLGVTHKCCGLLGEWLAGGFCSGLAVEQLLHFRQSSILNQGAAEQSGARSFFRVCRLAAFQGSWEGLVGCRAVLHLCSDYHPHGITTDWSNSMSTLMGQFHYLTLPLFEEGNREKWVTNSH